MVERIARNQEAHVNGLQIACSTLSTNRCQERLHGQK